MLSFWLIIIFMLIIGMLFVIIPLLKKPSQSTINRDETNLALYKQRLAELQLELDNQKIDQQTFIQAKSELENNLLVDLPEDVQAKKYSEKRQWWAIITVGILFPLIAVLLYFHWGSSQKVKQARLSNEARQLLAQYKSPQEVIDKLKERLQQQPDKTGKGWYLLGRLYFTQGQFTHAENAFAKAYQLQPDSIEVMVQYAEALFFTHHKSLPKKGEKLLEKVLSKEPNNPAAINLLAINDFQRGKYQQAISYWQTLLARVDRESSDYRSISQAITTAQNALQKQSHLAKLQVKVHVSLSKRLKEKAASSDTVFVYAQAAQGPKMPLAIARKSVADLPLTVHLTNAMAMTPQATLAEYPNVVIIARLSKTGNAIKQSGDIEAKSGVINVKQNHDVVSLEIKQ